MIPIFFPHLSYQLPKKSLFVRLNGIFYYDDFFHALLGVISVFTRNQCYETLCTIFGHSFISSYNLNMFYHIWYTSFWLKGSFRKKVNWDNMSECRCETGIYCLMLLNINIWVHMPVFVCAINWSIKKSNNRKVSQ